MEETDRPQSISKSAIAFLSGTFLSRVTGMCRDIAMAFSFGAHPAIAAFLVAFRFSNLLRRLFGEGQMTAGFIPYFESIRKESPEKGALFFRDLFHSLSLFLILLIAIVEIGLYFWWRLERNELLFLTMLMLPGTLFICLFGLTSSLLQCEKRFFLPGFAPVAFNFVWIGAALLWRNRPPEEAAIALSVAIVIAFAMQWLTTVPATLRYLKERLSFSELFRPKFFPSEILKLVQPLLYGMIGIGAVQINTALDGVFARFASLEGPAYLWYAIRMEQLPLALFGIALASALLPPLARAIEDRDEEKYRTLLQFALKRSFAWIFPCMMAIFVLGAASVNLLYGHGHFSEEATRETLFCLWGYGAGLLPSVFVLLLAPAFYAQKDYRTPMRASLFSVLLNLILNTLMVFVLEWGAFSIAIATSGAALFNCFYLMKRLAVPLFSWSLFRYFAHLGAIVLLATSLTLLLGHFLISDPTCRIAMGQPAHFVRTFQEQLLHFLVQAGAMGLFIASYAWMGKVYRT
jgi:putative peptidoglycan lipid II flippase